MFLTKISFIVSFTHYIVDVGEEELKKALQSAEMQAGISLGVWAFSLAPEHHFGQPELHLLGINQALLRLGLAVERCLTLSHGPGCGEQTSGPTTNPRIIKETSVET